MLSIYFPNKDYVALYIHVFGDSIANKLIQIFTGVFFYSLGMPLPYVLLFFGLEFGVRGLIAPMAPVLVSKLGLRKAVALSYLSLVAFFLCVGLARVSLAIGFFAFVLRSFSRGIYYPCIDTLHSLKVMNGSRGRQYTLELVCTAMAGLMAVGLGSFALSGELLYVGIALLSVMGIAIAPLLFIDTVGLGNVRSAHDSYRFLLSPEFRENIVPFTAQSIAIIANMIAAPIFLFTLVDESARSFSVLILLGILIQMSAVLLYGAIIDKEGHDKTLQGASFLQAVGNVGYITAMQTPIPLVVLTGFNNTAWDMYSGNYISRVQQKAQKSRNALLFNTATQMTLCFVEVVVLSVFSFIAWLWGSTVFVAIFFTSIVCLYISTKYFKD